MVNSIFISYAGENRVVAEKLEIKINNKLKNDFYCELVEKKRIGDTTFTEKVINNFKRCNLFIVILTSESLTNQFVNQEWGYAKALKELGQIQEILHVTEVKNQNRIKSRGFISDNMDFIDLVIDRNGQYLIDEMIENLIGHFKANAKYYRPIITEIELKIVRAKKETSNNLELINDLIQAENDFRTNLSMNPLFFSYHYLLQLLEIGHYFKTDINQLLDENIIHIREINERKILQREWSVSRGQFHSSDTNRFYDLLSETKPNIEYLYKELNNLLDIYTHQSMQ